MALEERENDQLEERSSVVPTHVLLDTKESCFLCHHYVISEGDDDEEEVESWRNLGGICSYLKICASEVILQSFKNFRLNQEKAFGLQKNGCLFWVNLCSTCGKILEEIGEGIGKMDIIRIWRIKRSLQTLLEILVEGAAASASGGDDLVRDREEISKNAGECRKKMNDKVVERLREELNKKGAKQLEFLDRIMSPKVSLSRCSVKAIAKAIVRCSTVSSEVEAESSDDDNPSNSGSNASFESVPPRRTVSEPGGAPSKRQSLPGSSPCKRSTTSLQGNSSKKRERAKRPICCPICNKMFRLDTVKRHTILVHPEQLFLDVKPAEWSLPQFQQVCIKLIRGEGETTENGTKCLVCKETYRCARSFSYHLLNSHREILTDKLSKLTEADKLLLLTPPKKKDTQCPYCNKILSRNDKMTVHCVLVHPENLFLTWKSRQQSVEDFKVTCLEVWRDLLDMCPQSPTKSSRKCLRCDATFKKSSYLLKHIVFEHRQFVIMKLRRKRRVSDPGQSTMEEEEDSNLEMEPDGRSDNAMQESEMCTSD